MNPLLTLSLLTLLTGCAGLNVSWVATATYNTPANTQATLTPGAVIDPMPGSPK